MRSAFGGRFIEAGQKPAIAALSACGIALYLAYHLTRFQVSAVWPLAPRGDASIVFDQGAWHIVCRFPLGLHWPDWVVLMLAPLPFSPWLEPYHAVPVLLPYCCAWQLRWMTTNCEATE